MPLKDFPGSRFWNCDLEKKILRPDGQENRSFLDASKVENRRIGAPSYRIILINKSFLFELRLSQMGKEVVFDSSFDF